MSILFFNVHSYVSRVEENSQQGTALIFDDPYVPEVRDDDMVSKIYLFSTIWTNNDIVMKKVLFRESMESSNCHWKTTMGHLKSVQLLRKEELILSFEFVTTL